MDQESQGRLHERHLNISVTHNIISRHSLRHVERHFIHVLQIEWWLMTFFLILFANRLHNVYSHAVYGQ